MDRGAAGESLTRLAARVRAAATGIWTAAAACPDISMVLGPVLAPPPGARTRNIWPATRPRMGGDGVRVSALAVPPAVPHQVQGACAKPLASGVKTTYLVPGPSGNGEPE